MTALFSMPFEHYPQAGAHPPFISLLTTWDNTLEAGPYRSFLHGFPAIFTFDIVKFRPVRAVLCETFQLKGRPEIVFTSLSTCALWKKSVQRRKQYSPPNNLIHAFVLLRPVPKYTLPLITMSHSSDSKEVDDDAPVSLPSYCFLFYIY